MESGKQVLVENFREENVKIMVLNQSNREKECKFALRLYLYH